MGHIEIRESLPADHRAIEALYPQAFPDEDLLPLVAALLESAGDCLSLVATIDAGLAGHVVFTRCAVAGSVVEASLLGPLAVAPGSQRRGVGSALIKDGFRRLTATGAGVVLVLGDPAYYGRFGFAAEQRVKPPYPLPDEWLGAWQSRFLDADSLRPAGKLRPPAPWMQPALWGP